MGNRSLGGARGCTDAKAFCSACLRAVCPLLLITASVELALYHYARQVVGQEYIRLNQAGLRQISYTLGQGMTDTQTLAQAHR